jgi:lipopolysaccharide biosynthesis regulator YciM
MQIPKEQILELLRSRGEQDKAGRADQELPDNVDTEQNADLLQRLGIDPQDLLGGITGKLGL